MALETQKIPVVFSQGVDTGTSAQAVAPGKFLQLRNIIARKLGRLQKRTGMTSLAITGIPSTIAPGVSKILVDFKGALFNFSLTSGSWYSASMGKWVPSTLADNSNYTINTIYPVSSGISFELGGWVAQQAGAGNIRFNNICTVIEGNYQLTLYTEPAALRAYAVLTDIQTKARTNLAFTAISSETTAIGGGVAIGGRFIYAVRTGAATVRVRYLDAATLATGFTDITYASNVSGLIQLLKLNGSLAVLGTKLASGVIDLRTINSSAAVVSSATQAAHATYYADITTDTINGYTYVHYNDVSVANTQRLRAFDSTLAGVSSEITMTTVDPTTIDWSRIAAGTVDTPLDIPTIQKFVHARQDVDRIRLVYYPTAWSGVPGTAPATSGTSLSRLAKVVALSALTIISGKAYIMVRTNNVADAYSAAYLLTISTAPKWSYAAKYLEGRIPSLLNMTSQYNYPITYNTIDSNWYLGVAYTSNIKNFSATGDIAGDHSVAYLKFNPNPSYVPYAVADDGVYIGGGILSVARPNELVEVNFLTTPNRPIISVTGGVGTFPAGTFSVIIIFEYTDAVGQVHRSAPSIPESITTVANDRINILASALGVTNKGLDVRTIFYVTSASGGTIYYRAGSTPSYAIDTLQLTAPPASNNQILYTQSGIVENVAPECVTYLKYHKARLFALTDTDVTLAYTKLKVLGEPFSFAFTTLIDTQEQPGGKFVALASLDDKLIMFQRYGIKYLTGDGPNDTGEGNDYQTPVAIPGTVGVTNVASVVETPIGVMFNSDKGVYLLDRSLSVKFIGRDVKGALGEEITSAVMISEENEVWFNTRAGDTLVYNIESSQWSTLANMAAVAATLWQGRVTYVTAGGVVKQLQTSTYNDDAAVIPTTMETGWLAFDGIAGYQRIYEIGLMGRNDSGGTRTLNVDFYYDYDDNTLVETITVSVPVGVKQVGLKPGRQKCGAIKLVIRESSATAGFTFTGMELEVGVKKGLNAKLSRA